MKTLKLLYKIIYDDLKDADMIMGYAYTMAEEGHKKLADSMVTNARERLVHSKKIHDDFTTLVREMGGDNKERIKDKVSECMWDITHDHMKEWYEKIENCILKWK